MVKRGASSPRVPISTFPFVNGDLGASSNTFLHFRPGFGAANLKAPQSIKYNQNVSLNTVRWAMVDWLKDEHRDGIWKVNTLYIALSMNWY